MELDCCDAFDTEDEGKAHQVVAPTSGTILGHSENTASHLGDWLGLRLDCQPGDRIFKSTLTKVQEDSASSTVGTFQPKVPTASETNIPLGLKTLQGRSNKLIGTIGSLSVRPILGAGHCRGFSFSPGDDSAGPSLSDAVRDREIDYVAISSPSLVWQDTGQNEHDKAHEGSKDELLTNFVVTSAAGSGFSSNARRDGSSKSVLTTTISRSSRSSSRSNRRCPNSETESESLREDPTCLGNRQLAVAAAKAAKNRTTNGHVSHRHAGS